MSATPKLITDGLWHCLCPRFNATAQSTRHALLLRRRQPALQNISRRHISTDSVRTKVPALDTWAPLDLSGNPIKRMPPSRTTSRNRALLRAADFQYESTPSLYEIAREAALKENSREARKIVEYLVKERREEPNLRLYSILILANVNPAEGAAWRVADLLDEMQNEGLAMDTGICHDVLRVLSVHLDYLLRAHVLQYMQQRWLQLNHEGHHWVCAAFFREVQLEMGLEQLEKMRRDNIHIQSWLYDLAMYSVLEAGEFDEALAMLKERISGNGWSISRSLWSHMLDTASSSFHYAATVYCWNSRVIPGYAIPSSGTCLNVLTTAARAGDAPLATSVFDTLGKRSTIFRPIHYEQLLETYMSTSPPDLHAALTVLTIMTSVKLEPTSISTRPIFQHLRHHPSDSASVLSIITSLHSAGRKVPIAALNLLIEAYVETHNLPQALTTYKSMHIFDGPAVDAKGKPTRRTPFSNLDTFNILLRGAARSKDRDGFECAMFLMGEMKALGIRPDAMTFDRLIWVCMHVGELQRAWKYFDEMEGLGLWTRARTAAALAEALAKEGDEQCWDVLQRMHDRGELDAKIKASVETVWEKQQAQAELVAPAEV